MLKDALTRRRGRRPPGFCQEQTLVLTEQFSSMERDAFHVPYLSDKIPEAAFHGQAVKTIAYLEGLDRAAGRGQPAPRHPQVRTQTRLPHRRFHRGDRLVVSELFRLGRSLGQIVAILEALAKARASGRQLGHPKGSLGVSRLNGKENDIRRFLEALRCGAWRGPRRSLSFGACGCRPARLQ